MMMSRLLVVGLIVVLATGIALASRNQYGVSDQNTITFDNPVYVGNTLLPKGEYQVLHTMDGSAHVMVFKQVTGKNAVEAKVPCTLKPLKEKSPDTRKGYVVGDNKQLTLHELTFRGDTATHVF